MKKLLFLGLLTATLSACHYGQDEAQKTIETNEQYKSEKADYSVNRANVKPEAPAATPAPADSVAAK